MNTSVPDSKVDIRPPTATTLARAIFQLAGRRGTVGSVLVQTAYFIFGAVVESFVPAMPSKLAKLFAAAIVDPCIGLNRCIRKHLGREYSVIHIAKLWDIYAFLQYATSHKEFFQDIQEAQMHVSFDGRTFLLAKDQDVRFNDTSFNVKGYYKVQIKEEHIGEDSGKIIYFPEKISIYAQTNVNHCVFEYVNQIKAFYDKFLQTESIVLQSIPLPRGRGSEEYFSPLYKGPRESIDVLEARFIHTFFHPQISNIWKPIRKMATDPSSYLNIGQEPQVNLLLYGPPGTGKSNFAYRIARVLNRHIICVNLTNITKMEAMSIFSKPYFSGSSHDPSCAVYVLDEFDITVSVLAKQQKQFDEMSARVIRTAYQETREEKTGESKDPIREVRGYENNLLLDDLLELLQGPIPRRGSIIIATTNKYEQIREICPTLVRPGRLTPLYFGPFNQETLQEVSRFFFGQELVLSDGNISLCPAEVMIKVTEAKSDPQKDFGYFSEKIREMVAKDQHPK